MPDLSDVVKTAKSAKELGTQAHGALIPILEKEDLGYHVDQIISEYKPIRDAIEQKPYLRDALTEYMKHTLYEYKWLLYGAKTVDSVDKIAAVVELGAGFFGPQAETGVKAVTEPLEAVLKIPYAVYYTAKAGDYVAPLYFAAVEAASLIPYLGEAVDFADLYVGRVRTQMRRKVADRFLENIVKKQTGFGQEEFVN
jgi:hypothetical protein